MFSISWNSLRMLSISYSVYVWKNSAVKLCGPERYFAKRFFIINIVSRLVIHLFSLYIPS